MTEAPLAIPRYALHALLVGATRYALGRATYVVGETCDMLAAYLPQLRREERAVVLRDIRNAIAGAEAAGTTCGMPMDHANWKRLLDQFKNEDAGAPTSRAPGGSPKPGDVCSRCYGTGRLPITQVLCDRCGGTGREP